MLIHSVVELDDSVIVDNRLESEIKFRCKDENGVTSSKIVSGYLEPYRLVQPDDLSVTKSELGDNDVIICKFSTNISPVEVEIAHKQLQHEFEGHKVLMLCDDLDLMIQNPDEAISMLEKMIAHIKIMQ